MKSLIWLQFTPEIGRGGKLESTYLHEGKWHRNSNSMVIPMKALVSQGENINTLSNL